MLKYVKFKITPDDKCLDCKRTFREAYNYNGGEMIDRTPYPFVFFCDEDCCKGKFYCADCGVERRAEVKREKFLQLQESTYCFSFVSMMIDMESNVTTIYGLYFKA